MTQRHAAIFIGGDAPTHVSWIHRHIDDDTVVIAADSGWSHAVALGVTPHVLIGDMDSITPADLDHARATSAEIIPFDHDKDFTDSELALAHACSRGVERVTVISGGGDRFDHLLGLVHSLVPVAESGVETTMVCDDTKLTILSAGHSVSLACDIDETISLLPLGGDATGVTTKGLRWNLSNETLSVRASRGVSNRATATTVTIAVAGGALAITQLFATSQHTQNHSPGAPQGDNS